MSQITRCPACVTLFKVVPDQLRISDGWVRCGQCDEVFDAALHLLAEPPAAPLQSVDIDLTPDPVANSAAWPVELASDLPAAAEDEVLAPSLPAPPLDERLPRDDPMTVPEPPLIPDAPVPEPCADLDAVSFLYDKKIAAFSDKPWLRVTLRVLGLVLLLALSGQMIVHERDRIAASVPGLKPWLQALCAPLNCTLSPLRRIDALVIESASFTKIRGDAYRLNFMLKNTARMALALPAIELTLTDSSDQPVVRRVFLPSELGAKTDALAAGIEWSTSLAVALKLAGGGDRVVGYRVLAFYP